MPTTPTHIPNSINHDRLTLANCGFQRCAPGHSFGPFARNHLLIHYVVAGKGKYHRKDEVYDVCAGQAFVILPNEVTFYRADDDEPWEYHWVGAQGTELDAYIAHLGLGAPGTLVLTPTASTKLPALMQTITDHFLRRDGNPLRVIGYLHLFLAAIYDNTHDAMSSTGSEDVIDKALAYIRSNFSYDISFDWLFHQLAVSRAHFFRLFKARTGLSPQQYLVRYRIEKSQKLLCQGRLGVTETAHSCGFNDLSHFARIFKEYVGLPPREFRRNGIYTPLLPQSTALTADSSSASIAPPRTPGNPCQP